MGVNHSRSESSYHHDTTFAWACLNRTHNGVKQPFNADRWMPERLFQLRLAPLHPLSAPIIQEESPRHIGQVGDSVVGQVANHSLGLVTGVLGEMDGELADIISLG